MSLLIFKVFIPTYKVLLLIYKFIKGTVMLFRLLKIRISLYLETAKGFKRGESCVAMVHCLVLINPLLRLQERRIFDNKRQLLVQIANVLLPDMISVSLWRIDVSIDR